MVSRLAAEDHPSIAFDGAWVGGKDVVLYGVVALTAEGGVDSSAGVSKRIGPFELWLPGVWADW